jgi:hypothetical protein
MDVESGCDVFCAQRMVPVPETDGLNNAHPAIQIPALALFDVYCINAVTTRLNAAITPTGEKSCPLAAVTPSSFT